MYSITLHVYAHFQIWIWKTESQLVKRSLPDLENPVLANKKSKGTRKTVCWLVLSPFLLTVQLLTYFSPTPQFDTNAFTCNFELYHLGHIFPGLVSFQTQTFTNLSSTRLWA